MTDVPLDAPLVLVVEAQVLCKSDPLHPVLTVTRRGGGSYDVQSTLGETLGTQIADPATGRTSGGNFASYDKAITAALAYCDDLDGNAGKLEQAQSAAVNADLRRENDDLRAQLAALSKG